MSFISIASNRSVLRGCDYYKNGKVVQCEKKEEDLYVGKVSGSSSELYDVVIDVKHPKKSTCNCKFAQGNVKMCKHKIALYLAANPEGIDSIEESAKETEEYRAEVKRKNYLNFLWAEICKMSKTELRETLFELLSERYEN